MALLKILLDVNTLDLMNVEKTKRKKETMALLRKILLDVNTLDCPIV